MALDPLDSLSDEAEGTDTQNLPEVIIIRYVYIKYEKIIKKVTHLAVSQFLSSCQLGSLDQLEVSRQGLRITKNVRGI